VAVSLSAVAELVRPSVVQIRSDGSGGAGVVLWRAGELVVVTNAHVARVSPGHRIQVVGHARGVYAARVEHVDPARDLACLTLASGLAGRAPDLTPASLGDVARLRPGHLLVAVGHPFGLANAVTAGVVHSVGPLGDDLDRAVGGRGRRWIQADIRLAPGNSGGPLCDIHGRVVGINTMVAAGLALAIPVSEVRDFLRAPGVAVPA
jgi:serine protease Do